MNRPLQITAVCIVLAIGGLVASYYSAWDSVVSTEFVALDSMKLGDRTVGFYVNYSYDDAVLGFSLPDENGRQRYYPMYGSTYRGMPDVTLEVFASPDDQQMWVTSSWGGTYDVIGYYGEGDDRSIEAFDKPTPESFGNGTPFPDLDRATARKVLTVDFKE